MLKLFFTLLLILNSLICKSHAEIINKIEVLGNDRISSETVITFSNANIGSNISENDLNIFLKIYTTLLFLRTSPLKSIIIF